MVFYVGSTTEQKHLATDLKPYKGVQGRVVAVEGRVRHSLYQMHWMHLRALTLAQNRDGV